MVLTDISVASEAFLGSNLLIPSKILFSQTKLKLNFGLSILAVLFLIDVILV